MSADSPMSADDPVSPSRVEEAMDTARRQHDAFKSRFQRMVPEVLEAYLCGKSWENALDSCSFFRNNAPRFKDFARGEEHTHLMMAAHQEYLGMIDELLDMKAQEWGQLDEAFFAEVGLESAAMLGLLKQVEQFCSFEDFGVMMRAKYEAMVARPEAVVPPTPAGDAQQQFVRVLWDIENVRPVGCPQDAALKLNRFLREKTGGGEGADLVITAFVPPHMARDERLVKSLCRGSVVLNLCTEKREDADRKLCDCAHRESRVLDSSRTTFAVLSSDTDFAGLMQTLRAAGHRVISVHEYEEECSARKALELHAHQAFTWSQIFGPRPPAPAAAGAAAAAAAAAPQRPQTATRTGGPVRLPCHHFASERELVGARVVGRVTNWLRDKGFGFIRAYFDFGSVDFYCHATNLPDPGRRDRFLEKGEVVEFTVGPEQPGKKNMKATRVTAASGTLACQRVA